MSRHVYPSREVYHLWANQSLDRARNQTHSVSFAGPIVRSYSTPVARIVTNDRGERAYLVSNRHYSNTTAKHLSYVRQAIPSTATVFHVSGNVAPGGWNGSDWDAEAEVIAYGRRIVDAQGKADRARVHNAYRLDVLAALVDEANRFCRFFGLAEQYSPELVAEMQARAEAARLVVAVRRRARQEQRERERAERFAVDAPKWRNGELDWLPEDHYHEPILRLAKDGTTVETSRGATVPLDQAKRLYRLWKGHVAVEGERIGHYRTTTADEHGITIGCHHISREEADRFAESMGWVSKPEPIAA